MAALTAALTVLVMAALAGAQFVQAPEEAHRKLVMGATGAACPWLIMGLAIPDPGRRRLGHAGDGTDTADVGRNRRRSRGRHRRRSSMPSPVTSGRCRLCSSGTGSALPSRPQSAESWVAGSCTGERELPSTQNAQKHVDEANRDVR